MTESKIKKKNTQIFCMQKRLLVLMRVENSVRKYFWLVTISSNIKPSDKIKITIFYKSRGKIDNEYSRRNVFRLARTSMAPIFFIWLGTCEFTIKEARNLYINGDASANVDLVVRVLREKYCLLTIKQRCYLYNVLKYRAVGGMC